MFNPGADNSTNKDFVLPQDRTQMTTDEILDVAEKFLGLEYEEVEPGRFVADGGRRQFRMTESDLAFTNNHAGRPHVNFEIWSNNPYRFGRMDLVSNVHVFIIDID